MKTNLLLVALLGLLSGCTASRRDVNSMARSSGSESSAPQLRPGPQQPTRPRVYFAGEFTKYGAYAWTNGMSLKDGINAAGGFTKWANGRLNLVHRDGSKELYRLGPGRTLTNNPALKPEDVVIARGQFVDAF